MSDTSSQAAAATSGRRHEPDPVLYEVVEGVAVITLNRPHVRNAINFATAEALAAAFDRLDADPDASVAVLTGAGDMFCAGMDLKAISSGEPRPFTELRGMFGITAKPPEKPVIAAVERHALGGGLEIALACDLIVAGEDAKLGLPEVKRGLVAAAGGVLRLPRRIPPAVAMEMVLTGEPISAQTALNLGLISRICEPGQALERARILATVIAANAPLAVKTAKALVNSAADRPLADGFKAQMPLIEAVRNSADAREGATAFVEKRAPVWSGR
jgi:enoyl-CoA hydratase/carnithine racemase